MPPSRNPQNSGVLDPDFSLNFAQFALAFVFTTVTPYESTLPISSRISLALSPSMMPVATVALPVTYSASSVFSVFAALRYRLVSSLPTVPNSIFWFALSSAMFSVPALYARNRSSVASALVAYLYSTVSVPHQMPLAALPLPAR